MFDILETKPGTTKQYPVTYNSIKERTFLSDLKAAGKRVVFTDVPLTFPAPNVEGKLIAGGVLPKGHPFTHPASLADELEGRTRWPINGISWTTFHNRPMPMLDEAYEITAARQKVNERLLDEGDWDVAAMVYVATDRIQHRLVRTSRRSTRATPSCRGRRSRRGSWTFTGCSTRASARWWRGRDRTTR